MGIHPMAMVRGPVRINEADRAQLAESPVSLRRVAGLFHGHALLAERHGDIIVVASIVGLAQPFLLREIIDAGLPTGYTTLLAWLGDRHGRGRGRHRRPRGLNCRPPRRASGRRTSCGPGSSGTSRPSRSRSSSAPAAATSRPA